MITLITGATSGIGEQLAIKYAEQGDTVIACGRNTQKLAELAKHNNIETCQFDATNLQDIKAATLGYTQFDRVILNAGNCEYVDDARNFDSALFERVINVNLLSMGYCLEALLPKIVSGGQLVMVSSSVTYLPLPRSEAYGASKAGVSYLAKSLAIDLTDVDVTLVHPGFVKINIFSQLYFYLFFLPSHDGYSLVARGKKSIEFNNICNCQLQKINNTIFLKP